MFTMYLRVGRQTERSHARVCTCQGFLTVEYRAASLEPFSGLLLAAHAFQLDSIGSGGGDPCRDWKG